MLEKIKKLGNLPLVIILIVVVIIAIVLSIVKAQNTKETNAKTNVSETIQKEEKESEKPQIADPNVNVQEIEDETEETPENEEEDNIKYFIRVNYGQNVVTIYTKDSNGEYTVPYKAMVCSTGTATPRSGTYTIPSGTYSRGTWGMMIGNVWAQYFTRIKGSILFHSVPYFSRNKNDLEYLEYDKLGTAASAGCIRLTVENAKWIYNNCPAGTKVEFYTDSNPGPLVPPQPQKISEHEKVRGWDPTDPDSKNPWKTYNPEEKNEEPEVNNNNTTTNKKPVTTKPVKPTTPTTPTTPTPEDTNQGENNNPNDGGNVESPDNNTGNQGNTGAGNEGGTGDNTQIPPENEGNNQEPPATGEGTGTETPNEDQTQNGNSGEGAGEGTTNPAQAVI